MEVIMNQNDALSVLVQAVNLAQSKGAYSLQEAAVITQAVTAFTPKEEAPAASAAEPAPTETKKTSNKK